MADGLNIAAGILIIDNPNYFIKHTCGIEKTWFHEGFELDGTVGYLRSNVEQAPFRDIDQFWCKMDRYSTLRAEAMHREGYTFHVHQIISHPLFTFVKMYMWRMGIFDGKPGLILSMLYAYYTFVKYAKLWELERGESPPDYSV